MKYMKLCLALMMIFMLAGCSSSDSEKIFVFGDTTFNSENDENDVNPHRGYSGWACIRYGVGETLFKYNDNMELEPWLALSYDRIDDYTYQIELRDDVYFTSGKKMDSQSVIECLQHLIDNHTRANNDLKIDHFEEVDDTHFKIITTQPVPALLNYLSDPYGCIIDIEAGFDDGIVSGTGPYQVVTLETDKGLTLEKNEDYYKGTPKLDKIEVKTISDGDTLTMSLQSGELDGAYGLPYASLPLFENDQYGKTSCETSRAFFIQFHMTNEFTSDINVRKAIACAIDKKNFVDVLLDGNGSVLNGPFPSYMNLDELNTETYNLEKAKQYLLSSGWSDSDNDKYVDKDGKKLTLRYVTYPSRQELPLLAESIQASLKEIGIDLQVNCSAGFQDDIDSGNFDMYAGAFVMAPTGDLQYFFTTHCLSSSSHNRGFYESDEMEQYGNMLNETFDVNQRKQIATSMAQTILDDQAMIFVSNLKMTMVYKSNVKGLQAHPCDYYEITVDLDK